jgi:hypothetical protein
MESAKDNFDALAYKVIGAHKEKENSSGGKKNFRQDNFADLPGPGKLLHRSNLRRLDLIVAALDFL